MSELINSSQINPNITIPKFSMNTNELRKTFQTIRGECIKKLGLNAPDANKKPAEELAFAVLDTAINLVNFCGHSSHNRPNLIRIAHIILQTPSPYIIAPSCPDFSHENGYYNFKNLYSGVPLLAERQISFINKVRTILPNCKPVILIADSEVDDQAMLNKLELTPEKFTANVNKSLEETRKVCNSLGIHVSMMTEFVPRLADKEKQYVEIINESMMSRIISETVERASMYRKINSNFSNDEMLLRTVRTASQYMALGKFAADNNLLVSNHTTTNLAYYSLVGTALLHNPVTVY